MWDSWKLVRLRGTFRFINKKLRKDKKNVCFIFQRPVKLLWDVSHFENWPIPTTPICPSRKIQYTFNIQAEPKVKVKDIIRPTLLTVGYLHLIWIFCKQILPFVCTYKFLYLSLIFHSYLFSIISSFYMNCLKIVKFFLKRISFLILYFDAPFDHKFSAFMIFPGALLSSLFLNVHKSLSNAEITVTRIDRRERMKKKKRWREKFRNNNKKMHNNSK